MNAKLTIVKELLEDILRKFEGIDGSDFEVYYEKIIIPSPKDKTKRLQRYGDKSMHEWVQSFAKTASQKQKVSDDYIRPFWEAVLPYPLDEKTSCPDFYKPLKLDKDREVHFTLLDRKKTAGWEILEPVVKNAVEDLRLQGYEIGKMPDSEALIKDFPDRKRKRGESVLWYELLLKLGFDESQESNITGQRLELSPDTRPGLPDSITVEGLENPLCEASIRAVRYLLRIAEKIREQTADSGGEARDDIKITSGTKKLKDGQMRDQVFICYSRKDKRWLNDLQIHLKPYVRNGSVTAWSDQQISPGSKWVLEIKKALACTKVAVLLVTPDFLASEFIHENELCPLLKEAEKGKVTIIWIPIRACAYKETPLKDYQAAVEPDKPLANMKAERDRTWVNICEEIKKAVSR